jgi:hypothetical protein
MTGFKDNRKKEKRKRAEETFGSFRRCGKVKTGLIHGFRSCGTSEQTRVRLFP